MAEGTTSLAARSEETIGVNAAVPKYCPLATDAGLEKGRQIAEAIRLMIEIAAEGWK
jgi:hypothetical protein